MSSNPDHDDGLLSEVKRRRAELRASMGELERALASPAPTAASASWTARLHAALIGLYDDFAQHVAITEGSDGLYAELAQHSPRLGHTVDRLTDEHGAIMRRLDELLAGADATGPELEVPEARRAGTELLVVLMHHRQRGADLVFEAYELDIGGET